MAVTSYGPALPDAAPTSHVAVPEVSDTVLPATHGTAPPEASATENVTVPVGVPAEDGRLTTTAAIDAVPPVDAGGLTRIRVLEFPLETGCVKAAEEDVNTPPPG